MLGTIAAKEFRDAIRDGRFLWMCVIVAVFFFASLIVGWTRFKEDRALRAEAVSETREQWLAQGVKNPHDAAHYGVYAFKPATPLSLFDSGVNDYTGTLTWLEAHRQNEFKYKSAQDAISLVRFGDLSAAMVLQLLVPLLIFLLCFSAVAGEREDGTLRQVLALGVNRATLVWGKALGVGAILGVTLLPALALAAAFIALGSGGESADEHLRADLPGRTALLALSYLVYFAILIVVSLIVSIRAPSSRAALTILLAFWIFNGLLFPRAAADISRHAFATPSAYDFASAVAADTARAPKLHSPSHPDFIAFRQRLLERYRVSRVEDLPVNPFGLALQAGEEYGYRIYDRHYGELWRQFGRQDELQRALAILAPHLAIRSVSMALAATDFHLHRDFAAAAEQYRRLIARAMNDNIQKGAAGDSIFAASWQYKGGPEVWAKVPPFDYDPPALAIVLSAQRLPLLVLGGWLVVGIVALQLASRRMRIDAQS